MVKALIITGKLAENFARKIAEKYGHDVFVFDIDVAAFIKPSQIAKALRNFIEKNKDVYDVIIVPGLIRGDLNIIEKETGIKTYRGPKNIADLDIVFKYIDKIQLSKEIPACEIVKDKIKDEILREFEIISSEDYIKSAIRDGCYLIRNLALGKKFPVRIMAEINHVDDKSLDTVLKEAKYYIRSGADIIDLGFDSENAKKLEKVVEYLRNNNVKIPISVDTSIKENIDSALCVDCDIILSFDKELLMKYKDVDKYVVIIPTFRDVPTDYKERIKLLEENIKIAKNRGFHNIIIDPLLFPLNNGFINSILAYSYFKDKYPMLMGAGNVTELLDADSIGANAVLCGAAYELGVDILLTTEASDKTRGSVKELSTASKMFFIARKRNTVPKDLGIDLLILKEKKIKRIHPPREGFEIIKAKKSKEIRFDKKGYFKIFIDSEKIYCIHYPSKKAIVGKSAKEICDTILSLELISELGHALYLGRELQKAEFALKYNKSYVQS